MWAAAAATVLQSCPTLCDPIDGSPSGSTIPGILQARTLEWVAISFSNAWKWKVKVKSLSRVRLSATPWTVAYQAPPSMGFSRQEYWSWVPLPSLIDVNWTIKKTECQGTDTFKLWCWRRLESLLDFMEIKPVDSKGNQPWIFIRKTDAEAPKFCPPNGKANSLENNLILGKIEGRKRREQSRMRWLDGITESVGMNLSKIQEMVKDRENWFDSIMGVQRQTWLSDWITILWK